MVNLQASAERFRAMFDMASVGMGQLDPYTGLWLLVNRKLCEITGYSEAEILSLRMPDMTHPEDRESNLDLYQKVFRGELADYRVEKRYIRKDGTAIWVNVNATVIRDAGGKPLYTVATIEDISIRKEALSRLQESEEKFRKIFQTNQDSICLSRISDGMYILINKGFTSSTGFTEADVIGRTSLEISIWEGPEDRRAVMEKVLRDGMVENHEAKFRRKDGSIEDGLISASRIDLNGIPHLLSVTKSLKDLKKAERRQRDTEEKYRILMENAIDAIHISQDGLIKYANAALVKTFGYSKEELLSRPFADFIHPEDREFILNRHRDRRKIEDLPSTYTYRVLNAAGDTRWVEQKTILAEWEGRPATLNFLSDITARKSAELELERARDFIQNVEDSCYEVNLEGRLTFCNEAFLKTVGYTFEEYAALSIWDRHPTREEALRVLNIYREVYRTGDPARSVEHYGLRKDGSVAISEISIYLIRDKAGNPIGFRGTGKDVGERRELQERLQRAEKMEALGTLAGGVAHDLNNVMGVVLGYAELLLMGLNKTSRMRKELVSILDAGRRAAAIVQDLLTLARRGVYTREVLNLNKIVSDVRKSPEFEMLSAYHPAVEIRMKLAADLPNISGSPVHLEKTLFNLISNASEAMPNGGAVTIRTENRFLDRPVQGYDHIQEGDYIVLSVSDTGEGIPQADLKRIFEPFYTKKVMGRSGTGLGLAVVWGTVKDHNGYINVRSGEGKGSTFTLYFPVTREEMAPKAASVSLTEYMGHGETVLVVDDVEGQRELASKILGKLNYDVACVSSGEAALAYLREHPVDLLILDMIMDPGIDGLETYRRAIEIRPGQKAIIVSGFAETERVTKAQELGAGTFVRKPYVLANLGLALRRELDRK